MSKVKNSILVTRVIEVFFIVLGEKALISSAIQILKTITKKLENKFDSLRFVSIF